MKTFVSPSLRGHVAVSVEDGINVALNGDQVKLDLATLRDFGLTRLLDVTSHHINQIGATVSHVVRFVNGGHVAMAWTTDGTLIEMTAEDVEITLDAKGRMLLGPMPSWLQAQLPVAAGREA